MVRQHQVEAQTDTAFAKVVAVLHVGEKVPRKATSPRRPSSRESVMVTGAADLETGEALAFQGQSDFPSSEDVAQGRPVLEDTSVDDARAILYAGSGRVWISTV